MIFRATADLPAHTAACRGTSLRLALLWVLLCSGALAETPLPAEKFEEPGLPLPRWSEQELKTFRDSLPAVETPGPLLPKNVESASDINTLLNTPLSSGPRLDHFFSGHDGELSPRLKAEDMRLFLPESILGLPTQGPVPDEPAPLPTPLASLKNASPEFLAACAQSLPKEYLIDPELLLPEMQSHDMMRLLEFHAQDARIRLYVVILPHDQKLPEGAKLEKFASGGLLQSDACLLVYPLGEPWRTRLFVSSSVHNQISTEFLTETIQACLQEALQASNSHDQLRRYTIHLSTRLFWLQKALGGDLAGKAGKGQTLAEFAPHGKEAAAQSSLSAMSVTAWSAGSLLLLGFAGLSGRRLLHRLKLKRQSRIWLLAEPETIPRLGGAFTGGGGCMIRYA